MLNSLANCAITRETISDSERYQHVAYQVIKHCPEVVRNVDPAVLSIARQQLENCVGIRKNPQNRPQKRTNNGKKVVSADSFVDLGDSTASAPELPVLIMKNTRHGEVCCFSSSSAVDSSSSGMDDIFLVIRQLHGGITNELYHVKSRGSVASSVVVRVFGKETDRVISRESELFYSSLFLKTYAHGKNFLICEFLDGYETMPFTDMGKSAHKIAEAVAHFQITATVAAKKDYNNPLLPADSTGSSPVQEGTATASKVSRFSHETNYTHQSLQKWVDQLSSQELLDKVVPDKQEGFVALANKLHEERMWMLRRIEEVEEHLTEGVCHNDLLCANLMYARDTNDLKIIDFDYVHRNYLLFDLANHFNEYTGLECDYARYFPQDSVIYDFLKHYRRAMRDRLDAYYQSQATVSDGREDIQVFERERELFWSANEVEEEATIDRWVIICKLLSLASHLSWSAWSLMQEAVSELDVDFFEYSSKRFQRYMETKEVFSQFEHFVTPKRHSSE